MYRVKYDGYWNGYANVRESKDFDVLEQAKAFAATVHGATIYKRVPSPAWMNSKWTYEEVR